MNKLVVYEIEFYSKQHNLIIQKLQSLYISPVFITQLNKIHCDFSKILTHTNYYTVEHEFQSLKTQLINFKVQLKTNLIKDQDLHEMIDQLQKSLFDAKEHFFKQSDIFQKYQSPNKVPYDETSPPYEADEAFLQQFAISQLNKSRIQQKDNELFLSQSEFAEEFYKI